MHVFIFAEITTLFLRFDRSDEKYYIGEDVNIEAYLENPSAVRYLEWKKKTDNESLAIDTKLSKYTRTGNETSKCFGLTINTCDESDAGTYLLLVSCANVIIFSNEISLQVVKGKGIFYSLFQYFFIPGCFACLLQRLKHAETYNKTNALKTIMTMVRMYVHGTSKRDNKNCYKHVSKSRHVDFKSSFLALSYLAGESDNAFRNAFLEKL